MADPGLLVKQMVQRNWPKFGTIRKNCTYSRKTNGDINPANGNPVSSTTFTKTGLMVIFDEFSFTEKQQPQGFDEDTTILKTDKKALFPALDLSVFPLANDEILNNETGETWIVKGVSSDPGDALQSLHVRKIKVS